MTDWVIIGVPSSAGAHHAGQERAPAALRRAGLPDRLRAASLTVRDTGDLPGAVFAVDHDRPHARNLPAVARVARQTADAVAGLAGPGQIPLVIGGDCTITLGVIALLGGGAPELAGLAGRPPLLDPARLAIIGADPRETDDAGRAFLAGA